MPFVSLTRATLRSAEFGFFGRRRLDERADAAPLRAGLERGGFGAPRFLALPPTDELIDRGHDLVSPVTVRRRRGLRGELRELVAGLKARAGRDHVADDDVLLEALQVVDLGRRRGLGEDARRLLEARGRDERARRERGLRDAEQDGLGLRLLAALLLDLGGCRRRRRSG